MFFPKGLVALNKTQFPIVSLQIKISMMMRKLSVLLIGILLLIFSGTMAQEAFYDFEVEAIDGSEFNFEQLRGKKVLIVNTASKCGFTNQYEGLQELYEKFAGEDFTLIGFPANNFKNQEPGTEEEIMEFCRINYGVTFPMMSKISVKGDDMHPLYEWLTSKELNGVMEAEVKWNFHKFLIDENGHLVANFGSRVKPMDDKIVGLIKK